MFFTKPRDIYSSIYPFYIFRKILGVSSFNIVNFNGRRILKTSRSAKIRYIFQFLFFIALIIRDAYTDDVYPFPSGILLTILNHIEKVVAITVSTANVFIDVALSHQLVLIFKCIDRIDYGFNRCGGKVSHKYGLRRHFEQFN